MVDAARPPMTARPSGASYSAPNATGIIPAIMAKVVIRMGRRRLAAPLTAAASAGAPSRRYRSANVASKIALATATPIAIIAPMKDCTFNVLPPCTLQNENGEFVAANGARGNQTQTGSV